MSESFQERVDKWILACFDEGVANDQVERTDRFLEEALELAQSAYAAKMSNEEAKERAVRLVDYVFSRPIGDLQQEVGGMMVTAAPLCTAYRIDMEQAGERELARVWQNIEKIQKKQADKKDLFGPLPGSSIDFHT